MPGQHYGTCAVYLPPVARWLTSQCETAAPLFAIFGWDVAASGAYPSRLKFEGYGDQDPLQTVVESESWFHKDAASNPRSHSTYATNSNTGLHAAHCSTLFHSGFGMMWDMVKTSVSSLFKIPLTAYGCGVVETWKLWPCISFRVWKSQGRAVRG
ncbi:hypothetical protein FA13DRAFT_933371 [Coprinellus micaceus]|uniref:Uncharacterized protein n=1 Tax=Coprinellus micaceus TaxID=71717 RepID=A0A4Y7SZW0_COPMI|nr:hypothetical protein FA13DRAFT_933371 [Coprinellus micaceus]